MSDGTHSGDRLECLKLAVTICHRDMKNDPKEMIALANELCDYVEGSSSTGIAGGAKNPPAAGKKVAIKSGQDPYK